MALFFAAIIKTIFVVTIVCTQPFPDFSSVAAGIAETVDSLSLNGNDDNER